uniref:Uncharacterized protein n=1 Tax=Rhizophora mucronata TaxID=61149 RepID=A0A2P2IX79_RHIMU
MDATIDVNILLIYFCFLGSLFSYTINW